MAIVRFEPSALSVEVSTGTLLIDAVRQAGLPIGSSCGVLRVCGKCNVRVVAGAEALSPTGRYETLILKKEHRPEGERLSCLARVQGDCTITTSYW